MVAGVTVPAVTPTCSPSAFQRQILSEQERRHPSAAPIGEVPEATQMDVAAPTALRARRGLAMGLARGVPRGVAVGVALGVFVGVAVGMAMAPRSTADEAADDVGDGKVGDGGAIW